MKNESQLPEDVRRRLFRAVQEIWRTSENGPEAHARLDKLKESWAAEWPGFDFAEVAPYRFRYLDSGGAWDRELKAIRDRWIRERQEADAARLLPEWLEVEFALAQECAARGETVLVRRVSQIGEIDNAADVLERLVRGLELAGWRLEVLSSVWSTHDETFFLPVQAPRSGGTFTSVGPGGRTTGYIVNSPSASAGAEPQTVTAGHILYTAIFRRSGR